MVGMKKTRADAIFSAINVCLMVVLVLLMLYPLYFVVITSFSEPDAVAGGKVFFRITGFTLDAYRNVFADSRIWRGYANTVFYTVVGTMLNLALTIPAAYTMSKRDLLCRGMLATFFLIPMYFGGGLIPTYLLVKRLGLVNTPVTMIILGGFSTFNMIVTRVYYQTSIPEELYESAFIDGANEFVSFFRIAIPLSGPILAVMTLYYAVGRWNDYFTALIYLTDDVYMPLQMVLRSILLQNQMALAALMDSGLSGDTQMVQDMARKAHLAETMKYALIFISSAPLLIAYPFVQRYFVKGVMIGALKG